MLDKLKEVPNVVWLLATLVIGGGAIALLVSNRNQQVLSTVSLPIEVVEYFDYQCSHCQNLQPTMVEIEEEFGDKVQIVPKYLPIFYNAATNYPFAYGAEAARTQGGQAAFDKYIAALNAEVALARAGGAANTITPSYIAGKAELNVDQFNVDFASSAVRETVNAAMVEVALEYDDIFKLESGSLSYLFGYGAEAAREQGMFIEYHNAVFDALIAERSGNSSAVVDPASVAESVGLDMVRFNVDFIDRSIRLRVITDRDAGVALGISSTPTIFIEGQRTDNIGRTIGGGETDYSPLIDTVDRYIKQGEANANQ
jgi:predicted DsbA family dithiol-disulfide isomerase